MAWPAGQGGQPDQAAIGGSICVLPGIERELINDNLLTVSNGGGGGHTFKPLLRSINKINTILKKLTVRGGPGSRSGQPASGHHKTEPI